MRAVALVVALAGVAHAECRSMEVSFQPAAYLQIAVWVEDSTGKFVDTIYLTRATGALGLANRPGNARFKSAYRWPYGRRVMVLPVWAHRRKHDYGYVVMGGKSGIDLVDDSIGYHESYSSTEPFYCPPSSLPLDATSCASAFVGSKGIYQSGLTSLYPPRADLSSFGTFDGDDAHHFAADNDLAAISGATPPGGQLAALHWMVPSDIPDGAYRVLVEASLEGDFNAAHRHETFLDVNSELRGFGRDILGQPSIVYATDITIDTTPRTATSDGWSGYGSWDGSDGALNPPDASISDLPGTGAGRLAHVSDAAGPFRLKVATAACTCEAAPRPGPATAKAADTSLTLQFAAPLISGARRYEVRYRSATPLDDDNFSDGIPAEAPATPGDPGSLQTILIPGLKAETLYYAGVRTLNACGEASPAQFASATTEKQKFVTLNGCFVATAAFGSPMEKEVALLRRFRDRALLSSPIGQLLVAIYYSHSPPLAAAISSDERLRGLARRALSPAVALARAWLLFEDARR